MDFSADPCNGAYYYYSPLSPTHSFFINFWSDFYQYTCGGFMDSFTLPPGVDMYIPIFTEVAVSTINNYIFTKQH